MFWNSIFKTFFRIKSDKFFEIQFLKALNFDTGKLNSSSVGLCISFNFPFIQ